MNNTEKKLDALIDALGFDVEDIRRNVDSVEKDSNEHSVYSFHYYDYKLTKRNQKIVDIERVYKQMSFALEKVLHCEPLPPSDVFAICKILGLTNEKI